MRTTYSTACKRHASFATPSDVRREVDAYLWGHTVVVETVIGRASTAFVLRTTSDQADYHAQAQVDRLRSGLWGARVIGDNLDEAIAACVEATDGGVVFCPSCLVGEHRGTGYCDEHRS